MKQSPMDRMRQETFRELHRDGLTEVVAGVALFIVALATGRPAFYWTYLALIVILGPGLTRLRARYTYPRIGFAELPPENRRRLSRGIVVWVVGAALAVAAVLAVLGKVGDNLAWRRAAPLLGGLLFAGGLLYLARRSGLKRVYGLALASAVTGALLTWPEIEGAYGNLRVWALLMALLCFGVGGVAFRRFVRETPVAEDLDPDVG